MDFCRVTICFVRLFPIQKGDCVRNKSTFQNYVPLFHIQNGDCVGNKRTSLKYVALFPTQQPIVYEIRGHFEKF